MTNPSQPRAHRTQGLFAANRAGLTEVWSGVIDHIAQLADMRREVASALDSSGQHADTTADIVLAASELATNALIHGNTSEVAMSLRSSVEPRSVELVVRHTDRGVSELRDPPEMATPDDLHGRGRAIVAAIADSFDTARRSGREVEDVARFVR